MHTNTDGKPIFVLPVEPYGPISEDKAPVINKIAFGDGYSQRVGRGINNNLSKWNITYQMMGKEVSDDLFAFFNALNGVDGFYWQPPGAVKQGTFLATTWSREFPYGADAVQVISAQFEEIAE